MAAACQGPPKATTDGATPTPDGAEFNPDGAAPATDGGPDGGTPVARLTPLFVTPALPACELSGPLEITVVDGAPTKVVGQQGEVDLADLAGFPLTVDAVLQEGIDAIDKGGRVDVEWSARQGVPSSITIDRMPRAIDDELILEVAGLVPAP